MPVEHFLRVILPVQVYEFLYPLPLLWTLGEKTGGTKSVKFRVERNRHTFVEAAFISFLLV
jgi:hypothetical protein